MRLTLLKNPPRWRISQMQPVHLEFLRQAAEDGSMADFPGARERLFPAPLRGRDAAQNEEFLDDWDEFVQPDLEMQFAGEVGMFLSDLDNVVPAKSAAAENSPRFQLDLPLDHSAAWFSTLNQARLMLDLKYKLHDPRDAPEESIVREQPQDEDAARRLLVLMRYEFFAAVQEWLVANVLSIGPPGT